ncbi:MAG: gfo/Idh/MocA family oxidoreductase [Candidatus Hydrogenedentota bacterium]|jgi:predicted dehydrogenase|uniref:Oxidoreductase, Gfo/Idh/MocA family n=1 Tax=Sumerlaea chitinivorans TaxID=2250252 RepID=A0A2Z4Y5A0_SUMC1|nr:Oxidoreductase, Gfo/Idh/MocA family [Candidatus Sumerlaea chitinivorans]MCX7964723.1 Gfo/Idh/MocA family oxidoreductase [Candidatus Sumerlaea chitinivorans]RMH27890.1 MAG: gfo/Idh/MocA family oxidoreductase [Candidatus Hydrogenedentota bacterium]GIX43986.1 MAG: UDP-N-acetylglucosamine 3-dehydrogenase [Candidatus Sumerlaea sp.]
MRKIRVGVVGVGNLGQHHARVYAELPECELVGVADVDPKALQRITRQFKVSGYTDYRELFGKVDACSIVVPTVLHHALARDFLEHGVHVLVEKPITTTEEEARDLIEVARRTGRILQVGHIERFNPAIMRLRQIVRDPAFIEGHRLGPYDPRVKDIGVVLDLMIHDLDIILQLVNSKVVHVEAAGVGVYGTHEDIANARIHFENGCIANLTASRVTPERKRKIRVFQRNAYISIDYINQEVEIYRRIKNPNAPPGTPNVTIVRTKEAMKKQEPLKVELKHFLECVAQGSEPMVRGEEARDALSLAVQISRLVKERWEKYFKDF